MFLILLLYTFFIDSFIIPYCNFEKNSTKSQRGMGSRAQLHPAFRNIRTLRRATKSVPPNPRLRAFLYQLPRFLGNFDDRQPTLVLLRCLATRISATWTYLRQGETPRAQKSRQGLLELIHNGLVDIVF